MSYKPIDNRRDQFRQYIESNGVIEMLSKVFIELLESKEKPEHPIDYIRTQLGATLKETNQIQFLTDEVNALRGENDELKKQLDELRRQLDVNLSTTLSSDDDTNKTSKTIVVNSEDLTNDSINTTSGLQSIGVDLNNSAPAAMITTATTINNVPKEKPISNNTDAGGGGGDGGAAVTATTETSTISTNDGEIQVQLISSATEDAIVAELTPPPVTTDVLSEKSVPEASTPIATEVDKNPKNLESQKASSVENN